MALRSTTIQVPIKGLSTQANSKNALPGDADLIENMHAVLFGPNSGELRKRNGGTPRTTNILGGGSITNARRMVSFGTEQLLITDTELYSWSSIAGAWVAKGPLTPAALSTVAVATSISSQTRVLPDAAVGGGYLCQISRTGSIIQGSVVDLSTGATTLDDFDLFGAPNANGARVVALATCFMIIAMSNNGSTLSAVKIAYATPGTVSAVTTIATNANLANQCWDVARAGSADQVMIAYNGDAAALLRAVLWNSNMTSAGALTYADQAGGCVGFLTHDYADGKAHLAWCNTGFGVRTLDITISGWTAGTAVAVDFTVTTARNITGYRAGGVDTLFAEVPGASDWLNKIQRSAGGAFADWQLGMGLRSRVFKVGSGYYVGSAYADGQQDKYFVLNAADATSPPQVIANALDGLASGLTKLKSSLASVPAISSTVVAWPVERFAAKVGTIEVYGAAYLRVDFAPGALSDPKQIGDVLFFPGAAVRMYDGVATAEAGFPVAPVLYQMTTNTIGTLTPLATYSIVATYVFVDSMDQPWESSPSDPLEVTLTGGDNWIQFRASALRLGNKAKVYLKVYVTDPDGDSYSFSSVTPNFSASDYSTCTVSAPGDPAEGELYTVGGKFPHSAFPPASYIEAWGDRLILAGTDEPGDFWPSNPIRSGEGVSVSDQLVIALQSNGDAAVSVNEMEDRLIFFAETSIYWTAGQGPSLNGDGQYTQPARIEADVGAVDARSVTKTKEGLIFKSLKGIWLLTRALQLVRIGAAAEAYDSLTITSGCVVEGLSEVRLTTDSGRTLVYHTEWKGEDGIGNWATFTGQPAVDSIMWGGKWCYLSSAGVVTEETAGSWQDNGANFTAKLSIGWLNLAGLFGEYRVWEIQFLADIMSSFTLNAAISVDFDPAVVQPATKAVTVATIPPIPVKPLRQDVRSLYLTLSETSSGEGFRIAGLAVELGVEGRMKSTAPSARMT